MSALRILACFKVTPDFEALRESEWAAGAAGVPAASATPRVDARFVRRILNCFDESALELALRARDALTARGLPASVAALTVGAGDAEPHLKTLLALGCERVVRVHAEAALDFAPAVTAALIAAYARRVDQSDLLVLGARSGPGDGGTIPFRVAEALGWPCVTQVTELEALGGERVRVVCEADDGLLALTLRTPCVLAVGNAVVSHLRVPTLSDRLASRTRHTDVVDPEALGVDVAALLSRGASALASLETIDRHRRGLVIEGQSPRDKAHSLYDSHVRRLLEKL